RVRSHHAPPRRRQLAAGHRGDAGRPDRTRLSRSEEAMAQALTQPLSGERICDPTAVPLVTTTLAVEGMHCGGCMRKVETALAGVRGVVTARANLSAARALVVHEATEVSSADLVEALRGAGFKAAELIADPADIESASDRAFLQRAGVAGFAAANIMLLSV